MFGNISESFWGSEICFGKPVKPIGTFPGSPSGYLLDKEVARLTLDLHRSTPQFLHAYKNLKICWDLSLPDLSQAKPRLNNIT
jgi:hypothetical protein